MSDATPESDFKIVKSERKTKDIYGDESQQWRLLRKSMPTQSGDRTNQGVAVGARTPLIDKMVARELRDANTTHGACIDAKASATVGAGHRDESIHETLDPLCQFSWQDVLDALSDDFWETGECFLEAAKNDPNDPNLVTGLFHVESAQCQVEVEEEDNSEDFHYVVTGETNGGQTVIMARWGDLEALKKRFSVDSGGQSDPNTTNANDAAQKRRSALGGEIKNSEIIHIRLGRNRSRWYGFPDYMSAVPSIELVQCMTQHEFDFYFNRAVPEFITFLIGPNTTTKTWEKFETMLRGGQGLGNSHKTCAVQIPGSKVDTSVQVERLAMDDNGKDGFSDKSMTLAMLITTAHGVPPMLANVALPAKIGGTNEGPNALMLIQKRKIGPAQRNFSTMLARTLGAKGVRFNQPEGAPKSITADQFLGGTAESKPNAMDPQSALGNTDANGMPIHAQSGNGFKTILDGMTLGAQDTLSRMKEPLAGSGRNPADGLLGGADDRSASDPKKSR